MRTKMKTTIGGKIYNTETATIIADNEYCDGANWDRCGRNAHLYKTQKGAYFVGFSTIWQGERDHIEVLSKAAAKSWYDELPEQNVEYDEAFDEQAVEA